MHDAATPIDQFLCAAAAKQPTPGGGSVAALVGALAASMGEMTLNYTVGKKGTETHDVHLREVLGQMSQIRAELLQLMAADQHAYATLTAARKLAPGAERDAQFSNALAASIDGPRRMAAAMLRLLSLSQQIVAIANRYLLSDLAVCGDLAMAALRCAVYNIRANLPDLTDPAARRAIERDADEVLATAVPQIKSLSTAIWARADGTA